MPTKVTSKVLPWLALIVVLLVLAGGARAAQVHAETWEWGLWPSAAPPRIEFGGRHYIRTSLVPTSSDGLTAAGTTWGGGSILVGARIEGSAPTGIAVLDNGQLRQYSLSGGP